MILFSYNQGNIACSRLSACVDEWTGGRNRRGKEWKDPSSSQTFPIFSHTCLCFRSSLLYQSFPLHSVANKALLKRLFYIEGLTGVYHPTFSPTPQLQRKFEKFFEALSGIAKMKFQHSIQQWNHLACPTVFMFDSRNSCLWSRVALEFARCQQNLDWINNHKSLKD